MCSTSAYCTVGNNEVHYYHTMMHGDNNALEAHCYVINNQ